MTTKSETAQVRTGTKELVLPEDLRIPVLAHLANLKQWYLDRDWGGRVGYGKRPAVLVIDLALFWTRPDTQMGSDVDPVVDATFQILVAARAAKVPIFFSTFDHDPNHPPSPNDKKLKLNLKPTEMSLLEIDPRLERQPGEKLFRKRFASCFKATCLHEMLAGLGVDTLIVTGVSTSHCVYATCRDATSSFRVIVPHEAVGDRCEIMHEVNLLDIDLDVGDVRPLSEVVEYLHNNP